MCSYHTCPNFGEHFCYAAILPLYEKRLNADQLERDWSYVVAALLAEAPDAENLRDKYLCKLGNDPYQSAGKQYLRHFDRKIFVEGKIPPGALP